MANLSGPPSELLWPSSWPGGVKERVDRKRVEGLSRLITPIQLQRQALGASDISLIQVFCSFVGQSLRGHAAGCHNFMPQLYSVYRKWSDWICTFFFFFKWYQCHTNHMCLLSERLNRLSEFNNSEIPKCACCAALEWCDILYKSTNTTIITWNCAVMKMIKVQ